ncbi:hypothetical protein [Candidatus Aquicultor sp.]
MLLEFSWTPAFAGVTTLNLFLNINPVVQNPGSLPPRGFYNIEIDLIVKADEVPTRAGCLRAAWNHQGIKR